MKLFKYEAYKLLYSRLYIIISVILLAGNIVWLWNYEKKSDEYFYYYENRELYREYQRGGLPAESSSYYESEEKKQEDYVRQYRLFIDDLKVRAERMSGTGIFSSENGFPNRNIQKTLVDYEPVFNLEIKAINTHAIDRFADYETGVYFLLIFTVICTWFVMYSERKSGLIGFICTTENGRFPLAVSKYMAVLLSSTIFTLILSCSELLFVFYIYGIPDLLAPVQSSMIFRGCPYLMSFLKALLLSLLVRLCLTAVVSSAVFALGVMLNDEALYALLSGGIFVILRICYGVIPINSQLGILRCITPFYVWNIKESIGEYYNLNLFGVPVSKNLISPVCGMVVLVLAITISIAAFCRKNLCRRDSFLERLMIVLRTKAGNRTRYTGLVKYEIYKSLFQQKKILLIMALVGMSVIRCGDSLKEERYTELKEAAYHFYMNKAEGKITLYNIELIEEARRELYDSAKEIALMFESEDPNEVFLAGIMMENNNVYSDGVRMVEEQLEKVERLPQDKYPRYLVDGKAYEGLWGTPRRVIFYSLIHIICGVILVSGLYPVDICMSNIVSATLNGAGQLRKAKACCAILYGAFVYIAFSVPEVIALYRVDSFKCLPARLEDFVTVPYKPVITVWMVVGMVALTRMILYFGLIYLGLLISKIIKKEMVSICIVLGGIILSALFFYYLSFDINRFVLSLFRM